MTQQNTIHWLHISDYHEGQKGAKEFWPQVRARFRDNLKSQCEENGPLDLVIFSGDLVFKGDPAEYKAVKEELIDLWQYFASLGQNPKLFLVPGNHDLQRPGESSALSILAQMLRQNPAVKKEIFDDNKSHYRLELLKAFKNYTDFVKDISEFIPVLHKNTGKIPGDTSSIFQVNGLSVGIVGLNSAWTHLSKHDLNGKLDIYVDQLNSVTNDNPPAWLDNNHLNLLVTHHPSSWFHNAAEDEFNSEIDANSFFDAHLFGHMHDNLPESHLTPWGTRRKLQVSSLFGMERFRDNIERKHGYYFVKVDANSSTWTIWPRIIEKKSGGWDIGRDSSILRGDSFSLETPWNCRKKLNDSIKK
ncbi:hypothetical protein LOY46_06340 [Pseudomonas sichuanensis]|uniref:metallophosphoesterase family protein n=1 Tax=Pseudomonas sichuanensis TaxID=2213015 RepID=UPI00215E2FBD|nr:metallophosphoesterase [Pseudomonas sichuanensis]UVK84315.1 hypothetical protein LOY46_06340 [Pseudomonas sichuanensis]